MAKSSTGSGRDGKRKAGATGSGASPARRATRAAGKAGARKPVRAGKAPAARRAAPRKPAPTPPRAPARPPPEGAQVDYASLTLKDALDLAILVEKEARERYLKLSTMVGGRYTGDACDVFRTMAENEVKHETELQAMRDRLFKRARTAVSRDALFDVEAPDWTKANVFMSPRQAVEVALESEEKACDFYEAALPHVKDPAVRKLFEGLSVEERQHRASLRKKLKGLPPGPDLEPEFVDEPGSDPG